MTDPQPLEHPPGVRRTGRGLPGALRDQQGPPVRPDERARDLGAWWATAALVLVGLGIVLTGHLRAGGMVVTAGLGLGAVLRALLPPELAGGLVVRSLPFDLVAWTLAAAGVLAGVLLVRV